MDLNFVSFSIFLMQIEYSRSSVYYSEQGAIHGDAENICQSYGGRLLEYGQLFLNASVHCGVTALYIWVGTPFYAWSYGDGCKSGTANKRTPAGDRGNDKHVAVCADFCSSDNYTHFGLTTTECFCYDQDSYNNLADIATCQTPYCTPNIYEYCGVSPEPIVYLKETPVNNLFNCRARIAYSIDSSSEFIGYCAIDLPYFCKIGLSDDIECSTSTLTTQQEELVSTTTESELSSTTAPSALTRQAKSSSMDTTIKILLSTQTLIKTSALTTGDKITTKLSKMPSTSTHPPTSSILIPKGTTESTVKMIPTTTTNILDFHTTADDTSMAFTQSDEITTDKTLKMTTTQTSPHHGLTTSDEITTVNMMQRITSTSKLPSMPQTKAQISTIETILKMTSTTPSSTKTPGVTIGDEVTTMLTNIPLISTPPSTQITKGITGATRELTTPTKSTPILTTASSQEPSISTTTTAKQSTTDSFKGVITESSASSTKYSSEVGSDVLKTSPYTPKGTTVRLKTTSDSTITSGLRTTTRPGVIDETTTKNTDEPLSTYSDSGTTRTTVSSDTATRPKNVGNHYQDMIIGTITGIGGLLLAVAIIVVLLKACHSKLTKEARADSETTEKRLEKAQNQRPVDIFSNMYKFPEGVNPFNPRRIHFYDDILTYDYDNYAYEIDTSYMY